MSSQNESSIRISIHFGSNCNACVRFFKFNLNIGKLISSLFSFFFVYPLDQWHISKPILIGLGLGLLLITSGSFNAVTYTTIILIKSGATVDPAKSAIFVGLFLVIGTYSSTLLVDRVGRRKLLIISAASAAITSFCLGLFACLNSSGVNLKAVGFLPVIILCLYVLAVTCGVTPVPFVVFGELMTAEV